MSVVTEVGFFEKRKHILLRNKAMQTYFHAREPAEVTKIKSFASFMSSVMIKNEYKQFPIYIWTISLSL